MTLNFAEQLEQDCLAGQKTLATLFAMNRADLLATVERITRGKSSGTKFFFEYEALLATVYRMTAEDRNNAIEPNTISLSGYSQIEITFAGIQYKREGGEWESIVRFDRYFTLGL
jgi:hypothetical protein